MARGTTLLETLAVVVLVTVIVGAGGPTVQGLVDRATVSVAREALVGLVAEARVVALARGGATVVIERRPPGASIVVDGRVERSLGEGLPSAIGLELGRGRDRLELSYDALGLGRVASATIRLRLRDKERTLVISSYGRVRRR